MFKIAIDGPAGAGKSTISKRVAANLRFQYIDTGAMYRAITLKALHLGIDLTDENQYSFLRNTVLDVSSEKIYLDGLDVTEAIRSVDITNNVSTPSKIKAVRDWLVSFQRKISRQKNVVMDGRDIGTVVMPDADLKIFLDALPTYRALRRQAERMGCGIYLTYEETLKELLVRDQKDSTRLIAPLKRAADAVVIDSSLLTIEEVVKKITDLVNERKLIKMNDAKYYEGSEIKGTITNVTKDAIYLELSNGCKGVIYTNDLSEYNESQKLRDNYAEGGEFKALIKQIKKDQKTDEPLYILSTKLYSARQRIEDFEEIKQNDQIIKAKVVNAHRAGLELTYKDYRDIKIFLPIRAIDLNEKAVYQMKGEMLNVMVTNVDYDKITVYVSNAIALAKIQRLAKEAAIAVLNVGDEIEGVVEKILDFGAIVKIGEVTGLLHRNEISHELVRNIENFVKVGDQVKVKIIKIDGQKISLSIKALSDHPWDLLRKQFDVNMVFTGTVDKVIPAGLLIKLTDRYSGLMPYSEYSWFTNERANDKYQPGDQIEVKVLEIDDLKKRVLLSHRATKENTWADVSLRKGQTIEVEIDSIIERGALVKYHNIQGFLPINEVTTTKRVSRVDEVFKIGDKVVVTVINFEPSRARLSVSAKSEEVRKEREQYEKYVKIQDAETPTHTIADALGDALKKYNK